MTNYLRALIQKYPFLSTVGAGAAAYYGPQFKPAVQALARVYGVCQ